MANMLKPCENPDIALAKKSKNKGVLFVLFGVKWLFEFVNFTGDKEFQKYRAALTIGIKVNDYFKVNTSRTKYNSTKGF